MRKKNPGKIAICNMRGTDMPSKDFPHKSWVNIELQDDDNRVIVSIDVDFESFGSTVVGGRSVKCRYVKY